MANVFAEGFRDDGGMISVLEPLHGLDHERLLQVSRHWTPLRTLLPLLLTCC